MENVKALAASPRWADTREHAARSSGQSLATSGELFVLNARDYDVPQARERMFLIGIRGRDAAAPPADDGGSAPDRSRRARAAAAFGRAGQRCDLQRPA